METPPTHGRPRGCRQSQTVRDSPLDVTAQVGPAYRGGDEGQNPTGHGSYALCSLGGSTPMSFESMTRRSFVGGAAGAGLLAGFGRLAPAYAWSNGDPLPAALDRRPGDAIDLLIGTATLPFGERRATATLINGSLPGPLVRLREGETAILRVRNQLPGDTSIHWHGLLVPPEMDGVPGVSFPGIPPGETFVYRYAVQQSGTYWYHSHTQLQEQSGVYGPLIIDPAGSEPFSYDRDYVVMLSDWTYEDPGAVLAKLKSRPGYYNFSRRTLLDLPRDARAQGWSSAVADRMAWAGMRMDPTDTADVTGYTYVYLMNGLPPEANWSALFQRGERVRLRFINGSAMTYYDVRIPGLKMTVVQADGQNVAPIAVDELRIAVAETYDVLVEPEERAYTIFAETLDRSGYARGTLTPRSGESAPLPERRPPPIRTMKDMGMGETGMSEDAARPPAPMRHGAPALVSAAPEPGGHASMGAAQMTGAELHGPDTHGPGNSVIAMAPARRLDEAGTGLENAGHRVLVYRDLRSISPGPDPREPEREVELHLTGNMERYMWGFDGRSFWDAQEPIPFYHGERLRLTLVNDTMMEHPIHLHGMWMELENGAGRYKPRKHTVNVKPAERLSVAITADAPGNWAFHCHLLYHMEMGMFRVVSVLPRTARKGS